MKKGHSVSRRFFAALTILSFTLTQALPLWASPEPAQTLRERAPEPGTPAHAGLEEAFVGGSGAGRAGAVAIPNVLLRFLRSRQSSRSIRERINALEEYARQEDHGAEPIQTAGDPNVPLVRRISLLDDLLGLALEESVLEEPEVDPELAVALLTRSDPETLTRARASFNALKRICPTCGDHLYHEQGKGQADLEFDQHARLHIRTAIATAVEFLSSASGRLPTVERVLDQHHAGEPARSLGVMALMVSAFSRNDEGSETPSVAAVRLGNDPAFLERLSVVTAQTGAVILRIRHPRTQGDEADTWMSVRYVDRERRAVDLFANGEAGTLSWDQFQRDQLPSGDVYGLLSASQVSLWSGTRKGQIVPATQGELGSVIGCCGIIITMGRRSGEGQFASMQDLAYRGGDDAGITVHDLDGLYTIKVEGSPTKLIRELEIKGQGHPEEGMAWYLDTFPQAELDPRVMTGFKKLRTGQTLNWPERQSIHRLWLNLTENERTAIAEMSRKNGRGILDAHRYGGVKPVPPGKEGVPPQFPLPLRKDDLYSRRFYTETDQAVVPSRSGMPRKQPGEVDQWNSVGRGNQGEVWSGRSFVIPLATESSHTAHVKALQDFQKEVNQFYDYELSYIRDRFRFHLSEQLQAAVAQGKLSSEEPARLVREFLRLFESVVLGRDLVKEDMELWKGIWDVMANTPVWFAGHIPWDPVRHIFRLQKGLVGILRQHPKWRKEVEGKFAALLGRDHIFESRDWFQDWLVENYSNTPSKAFEALTTWFQGEFIPDYIQKKIGIEPGRVDAVTLQYLEIVDEVFGHDRWATTGSKQGKDAQPHMDTGLLSGLSRSEKKNLVEQALVAVHREEVNGLLVSPTAGSQERGRVQRLLCENFLAILRKFLKDHPDKEGTPQRSTPHNGDLDSGVQQEVRLKVKDRGYKPVHRPMDENWQTHTETILTDTWGLLAGHESIYDDFELDTLLGLTDGQRYLEDKQGTVGFLADVYRRKWNEIVEKLLTAQKHGQRAVPITEEFNLAEEVAHRLVNLEFARGIRFKPGKAGSEIGAGLMTTMEPRLKVFVSHNRPIYLMAVRDTQTKQLVWQVSSDYRTALRLFDRKEVAKGVEDSNELFLQKERALEELDQKLLSEGKRAQGEAVIFRKAEEDQKAINDRFKLEFMFSFKGEEKYIHTGREFNPDTGQWDLLLEVSNFEGKPLARYLSREVIQSPPEREIKNIKLDEDKSVEVDIASRFGFPSYGEKEIHQIPLALRETRFWYGLKADGTLDMSQEGVNSRYGESLDYGLDKKRIKGWFQGGGNTLILAGVGSSENDALAAEELFKFLLPGVRVIVKDPSTLLNTAVDFDPKTTMVIALSWSGTTALTLSMLESLRERGLLCSAITGNPDKEIGVAVKDSAGVVKAHTRQEVAVYTTVGFSTILYDLMLMAAYFNLLKEELEPDEGKKADLKRRRSEIAPSLYVVPETIRELRDRPERSLQLPKSYIHEVGERLAPYSGVGLVGDDPALAEVRLKLAEVRNVVGTVFPYSSNQPWHLIRLGMPQNRRKGWLVDATTVSKFRRALAWIKEALKRGQPLVIQTFDEKIAYFSAEEVERNYPEVWKEFNGDLNGLAEGAGKDGRPTLDLFRVPRLHPLIQPIVNVQIGAQLATTTAKKAGLSSEFRDAPRNLAKSVTVQAQGKQTGAMRIRDFVEAYRAASAGLEEQDVMKRYGEELSQRWNSLDPPLRAVHRLPLRMQEILDGFSKPGGFSWESDAMGRRFGGRLEGLRRVVVLFSEDENAEISARMVQELLEHRESVTTNSEKEKIFQKERDENGQYEENATQRLINGGMYEIRFARSREDHPERNRLVITHMTEEGGEWRPGTKEIVLLGDENGIVGIDSSYRNLSRKVGEVLQYQVNGQWYTISADIGRGVNLTAVEPELAGVEVEVAAVEEEEDLRKATIHPEDTLVVALSRSYQREKEFEGEIAPIASVDRGRDAGQKQALQAAPGVKSEESFSTILAGLKQQHPELAIFSVAGKNSPIHRHANVGSAHLPEDLDVIDATPAFYLALLRFGIELGTMKDVSQAVAYKEGLGLIPVLAARTLPLACQERVVVGTELFSRATQGIRVALNHRPIDVRYEPESEVVAFHDEQRGQVGGFELVVDSALGIVRGFKNPANVLDLDKREYDIDFLSGHGLLVQSRQPDYGGGGSLLDGLVSLRQRKSGNPYANWIIVGGGTDFASATLYRKLMTALGGTLSHALVVDASVHGDLAEVDDRVAKWRDPVRRRGIDPEYDPDNPVDLTQKDAAILQLGTDRRAYSAITIDLQRFVTRSGIVFLVVQVPDLTRSEIIESGAFLALGVPEAPNLLTVIPHMVLAPIFAYQLGQSIQSNGYRYQEESPWAEVAQLPRVIPAEEEVHPMLAWEKALRKKVGPSRRELVQWFVEVYGRHRNSPDKPVIEKKVSATQPDMISFIAVIPAEHTAGREPIAGINSSIERYFRDHRRELDYDTRYYWTGFQEKKGAPQAGLFHISFRTSNVEALGAEAVETAVRAALQPYIREVSGVVELPSLPPLRMPVPFMGIGKGRTFPIYEKDRQAEGALLENPARKVLVNDIVAMAVLMAQAGAIGAFKPTGPMTPFYDLSETDRSDLLKLRGYFWGTWLQNLVKGMEAELKWKLNLLDGRLALADHGGQVGLQSLSVNGAESGKAILTDNYRVISVTPRETGSVTYFIAGPGVNGFWLSPSDKETMSRIHAMYADTLATHIPRDVLDLKEPEELRVELNPTVPIGEMEATLDRIASWNHLQSDAQGRSNLSQMRVVLLRVYKDGRQREHLRLEEFRRLKRERGLQILEIQDGTFVASLGAQIPPSEGKWTQEHPLNVVWTATHLHQAVANLVLTSAMPRGAWFSCRVLPSTVEEQARSRATAASPLGNVNDFPDGDVRAVHRWRDENRKDDRQLFLGKHTFIPSDIQGNVSGVIVPLTTVGILGSFPGEQGIPGVRVDAKGLFHAFPITVQDGSVVSEEVVFQRGLLSLGLAFEPPAEIPITKDAELAGVEAKFSREGIPPLVLGSLHEAYLNFRQTGEPQMSVLETELKPEQRTPGSWVVVAESPNHVGILAAFASVMASGGINLEEPIVLHEYRGITLIVARTEASQEKVQGHILEVIAKIKGARPQPGPSQAGLEEGPPDFEKKRGAFEVRNAGVLRGDAALPEIHLPGWGTHLIAEGGDSRIELAEGVRLEPNVVLTAPQGRTIKIGSNSLIMTGSQIWGNATLGSNVRFSGVIDAADPGTDVLIGDGTQFTRGSQTVLRGAALLPRIVRTRGEDGQVVEQVQPVFIKQAGAIEDSVVWGSPVFQFAVLLDSILDFGLAGNHVLLSRSHLTGVSPKNRTAASHYNFMVSAFVIPLVKRRDLTDLAQRDLLEKELLALRFGIVEERKPVTPIPGDTHASRPRETLILTLGDERVTVEAQSVNFGAGAGVSNFDPRTEVKGGLLSWGGDWAGVNAIFNAPVEIGSEVGIGSGAIVKLQEALEPGTLVVPRAAPKNEAIKSQGYRVKTPSYRDVEGNVTARIQILRYLEVATKAAAKGVSLASSDQERKGLLIEAKLTQGFLAEHAEDLRRYLSTMGVSAGQLGDQKSRAESVIAEAVASAAAAQAVASAAGLEEQTMANSQSFRVPTQYPIVQFTEGSAAFSDERIAQGLRKVKDRKPLVILLAGGAFSRFVESVNKSSPFFAKIARERGLANSDGNASKFTAPLGVSGLGPLLRILEGWSEVGVRAGTPIDLVIPDSPGNREMLLKAIEKDRSTPKPRIAWDYLNLLPQGIPVDQGKGLQAQIRDTQGKLKPLFEYNPETKRMDKPVMRPSGEFGAFLGGIQAAQAAGISIRDREIIPIYVDEAALYSDPQFVLAALGHLDDAAITGLAISHRHVNEQWAPSGGVWTEAQWPDGTQALVIAERNVRDPGATGVYNPQLDRDELAVIQASQERVGFPLSPAAPIFNGRFVEEELLVPGKISQRLSRKEIQVRSGENTSEKREALVAEMELTEAIQIATQHSSGEAPPRRVQVLQTDDGRYQAVKEYSHLEKVNGAIFERGRELLRAQLGGRVEGDLKYVEIGSRAKGFRGDGRLKISGEVGVMIDHHGLWVHGKISPEDERGRFVRAPTLFTEEGYLVVAADPDGHIPLQGIVEITPETYEQLASQAGLEEPEAVHQAIQAVLERSWDQLHNFYDDKKRPLVLLSDATTDPHGINSGYYTTAEAARQLANAGVTPDKLERLLDPSHLNELAPVAIDLKVAAQRLDGMDLAKTLQHARRRIQGTDGIRGRKMPEGSIELFFGKEVLSPDMVEAYGFSIVEWLTETGMMEAGDLFPVGYDPRDEAEIVVQGTRIPRMAFVEAFIRGEELAGARVLDLGVIPIWVPSLYMNWNGVKAAAHVTASHNYSDQTGVKLFGPRGLKLFPEDEYAFTAFFYRAYSYLKKRGQLPRRTTPGLGQRIAARDEAIALMRKTLLKPENSWAVSSDGAPIDRPLENWLVVVDGARGTYSGRAKDPSRPNNPTDPEEFGLVSQVVQELGAEVLEVGKNVGLGNVNRNSGVAEFEGSGLAYVTPEDVEPGGKLASHELFRAMFEAAKRDDIRQRKRYLVGILLDADGDRLGLAIYDPYQLVIHILTGDETAFVQGTFLRQVSPWASGFKDAVFATTVESDFFAADSAEALGFKKKYTGVGDKWILLQAMIAWMEAMVQELQSRGVPKESLDPFQKGISRLSGEGMSALGTVRLLEKLEGLAVQQKIPLAEMDQKLSQPGVIRLAIATEESGHDITALYLDTQEGRRVPVFAGNALKSAINTLVAFTLLFKDQVKIRTIYGKDVDLFGFASEPFIHGHKRTRYATYVDKTRFIEGSPASRIIRRVMEESVKRVFGGAYTVEPVEFSEEPGLVYLTLKSLDGKPVGAVFDRNSGTEDKTSGYVRGRKEDEQRLNRLADLVEVAANELLRHLDKPARQAMEWVLAELAKPGSHTLEELKRGVIANVPDGKSLDSETFFTELKEKARVIQVQKDNTVTLAPRDLEQGDKVWVLDLIRQAQAAAGLEQVEVQTTTSSQAPVTRTLGEAARPVELVRQFQDFRGWLRTAPAPRKEIIVDLSTDSVDSLAAAFLPGQGVVVMLPSVDDLLDVEKVTGRVIRAKAVTLGEDGNFPRALQRAVAQIQAAGLEEVRLYSGRSRQEVELALASIGDLAFPVKIIAPAPLDRILEALGADEATRLALRSLLGRARENWEALIRYL